MKALVNHLLKNNLQELIAESYMDCHAKGLHSLMLLDCPGKTIRMFIAVPGNEMHKNFPENKEWLVPSCDDMSIGFHAHHCNLTLVNICGFVNNWVVTPINVQGGNSIKVADDNVFSVNAFEYKSAIKEGETKFAEKKGSHWLKSQTYQTLTKGESVFMRAHELHTVACDSDQLSAWFVFEGEEDPWYENVVYSNRFLPTEDFSHLYRKPTMSEFFDLLRMVGLFDG